MLRRFNQTPAAIQSLTCSSVVRLLSASKRRCCVFLCCVFQCSFVPSKVNNAAVAGLCNDGGTGGERVWGAGTLRSRRIPPHVASPKDETHESYSRCKGHCLAQLPSAGAARGVKSHGDKTEMTLTQRRRGIRTRRTRWMRGTMGKWDWLHGASSLNKDARAAEQEGSRRKPVTTLTGVVVCEKSRVCVGVCARTRMRTTPFYIQATNLLACVAHYIKRCIPSTSKLCVSQIRKAKTFSFVACFFIQNTKVQPNLPFVMSEAHPYSHELAVLQNS